MAGDDLGESDIIPRARLNLGAEMVREALQLDAEMETEQLHARQAKLAEEMEREALTDDDDGADDASRAAFGLDTGMVQQQVRARVCRCFACRWAIQWLTRDMYEVCGAQEDEAEAENEAEREQAQLTQSMFQADNEAFEAVVPWRLEHIRQFDPELTADSGPFRLLRTLGLRDGDDAPPSCVWGGTLKVAADTCSPMSWSRRYPFQASLLYSRNYCAEDPPHRLLRVLRDVVLICEWRGTTMDAHASPTGVGTGAGTVAVPTQPTPPRAIIVSLSEAEALRAAVHTGHPCVRGLDFRLRSCASGMVFDSALARCGPGDTAAADLDDWCQWRQCARFFNADVWFTADEVRDLVQGLHEGDTRHRRLYFSELLRCRRRQQQVWTGSMLELVMLVQTPEEFAQVVSTAHAIQPYLPQRASVRDWFLHLDADGDGHISARDLHVSLLGAGRSKAPVPGVPAPSNSASDLPVPPSPSANSSSPTRSKGGVDVVGVTPEQLTAFVVRLTAEGSSGMAYSAFAVLFSGLIAPRSLSPNSRSPTRHVARPPSAVAATDDTGRVGGHGSASLTAVPLTGSEGPPRAVRFEAAASPPAHTSPGHNAQLRLPPSPRSTFLSLARQVSSGSNLMKALRVLSQLEAARVGEVRPHRVHGRDTFAHHAWLWACARAALPNGRRQRHHRRRSVRVDR